MSRRLLLVVLAALVCTITAAGALAAGSPSVTTQTASAGGVTATFTYRGVIPTVTDLRLKIVKDGQAIYDRPVARKLCGKLCGPAEIGRHASSVGIVHLLPGSPQVVLELYSGGANCCFIDQVFSYDPGPMAYVKTELNFGSAGVLLKRLHAQWRFVSADDGFKYVFTDGADSGEPIQIWRFSVGKFINVTRAYPSLIRTDAARWLALFGHHLDNGVGLIAAWAGDEELLGHDRLVQSTLKTELARGDLRAGPGNFFARDAKFITKLNRTLRALGYER